MMQGFEPYVVVSKKLVPWYDERFTGYLEDKVVHIQTMVHMGFSFAVHPSAFLVHYPHPDSKDQTLVKSTGLMQEVTAAFVCCLSVVGRCLSEWQLLPLYVAFQWWCCLSEWQLLPLYVAFEWWLLPSRIGDCCLCIF